MNKTERYDIRRFGKRLVVFLLLVGILLGFALISLYKAGELSTFQSYLHQLRQDQLFGLAYSNYDKPYKFYMTNEVEHPQVLALGSSRIMQVKRTVISPDFSFYNAGGAIQNLYEIPLFVKMLQDSPELILVNIDQWWFNPAFEVEKQTFSPNVYDRPEYSLKKLGPFICEFYEDLFDGKINIARVFGSDDIGLNAICKDNGYTADGSRYQGEIIKAPELQVDYNFMNVQERIRDGNHRFQYGETADSTLASVLDDFLNLCQSRHIKVMAFLPPFAPFVSQKLQESGKYGYMSQIYGILMPVFNKYKDCSLYDFTDMRGMGIHNYDFEDGFHGSEIIYNGILRQIAAQDSTLAHYLVTEQEMERLDSVYLSKNIRYHSME